MADERREFDFAHAMPTNDEMRRFAEMLDAAGVERELWPGPPLGPAESLHWEFPRVATVTGFGDEFRHPQRVSVYCQWGRMWLRASDGIAVTPEQAMAITRILTPGLGEEGDG